MKRSGRAFRAALSAVLVLALLISCASAAGSFRPAGETEARREALTLFCRCAFHPEYGADVSRLSRWEGEITVWAGGSVRPEELAFLDAFLAELREKVPSLPGIRRVRQDTQAALRIWFVPEYLLKHYIEGYLDGNWGFFHYEDPGNRIVSARIGIASDITEPEERKHLLLEELVGALGLPGDHEVYSDSILYDPWSTVQALSDVDWRMLNMLYSPDLAPGMTEEQAREILRHRLGL